MGFKRGDDVEIISKEEGFEGSLFEAIVIADLGNEEYIVQYTTLMKEDLSGPLRVFAHADVFRPAPENILPENGFQVGQKVDAYDNEGWWTGRITKKVKKKYKVHFELTGDEHLYEACKLRLHQDWVNGQWVLPEENGNFS